MVHVNRQRIKRLLIIVLICLLCIPVAFYSWIFFFQKYCDLKDNQLRIFLEDKDRPEQVFVDTQVLNHFTKTTNIDIEDSHEFVKYIFLKYRDRELHHVRYSLFGIPCFDIVYDENYKLFAYWPTYM